LALAMIETADGMKNLDEIVSTPGLDGVYIGPADLTLGLTGRKYPTGFDREEPEMVEAIQTILARAHAAGLRACLHCGTPTYAAKAIGWGFDLVTLSNDVRILAGAAKAGVDNTRQLVSGQQTTAAKPAVNSAY
jgi:4-hydroxy-2-oxoheptanedioate aldolase